MWVGYPACLGHAHSKAVKCRSRPLCCSIVDTRSRAVVTVTHYFRYSCAGGVCEELSLLLPLWAFLCCCCVCWRCCCYCCRRHVLPSLFFTPGPQRACCCYDYSLLCLPLLRRGIFRVLADAIDDGVNVLLLCLLALLLLVVLLSGVLIPLVLLLLDIAAALLIPPSPW